MSKPVAVLISDVHYNINTLEIADKAMRMAIDKANELQVPFIVAGDLHDTKAIIRGECINAMTRTFQLLKSREAWVLRGNHCSLNEKSTEHSLTFLSNLAYIVDVPRHVNFGDGFEVYLIPYHHDANELRAYLKAVPKNSTLIMHQGINGSNAGHYIQDKSAINKEDIADFRVLSGHYHQRQDIKTGRPRKGAVGLWTYLGNPYTLNFGEANDPPKGFNVLYDDGTVEFIPTNLRKHVIIKIDYDSERMKYFCPKFTDEDFLWVKVTGPAESVNKLNKKEVNGMVGANQTFKLDLIANESKATLSEENVNKSQPELLDDLINSLTNASDEQKQRLKTLWKDITE